MKCSWSSGWLSGASSCFGLCLTSLPMCCGNRSHCGCWLTSNCIYSTVEHYFPKAADVEFSFYSHKLVSWRRNQLHWCCFGPIHLEQQWQDNANPKNCLLASVFELKIFYPWLSEKPEFSTRTEPLELSWSFHTQQANRCQSLDTQIHLLFASCLKQHTDCCATLDMKVHPFLNVASNRELEQFERTN